MKNQTSPSVSKKFYRHTATPIRVLCVVPALLQKQSDGDQVDHIGLIYIPSGTYKTRVLTPALVCQSISSTALFSCHAKVGDQNLKEPRKGRPRTTKWRRPGMTAPEERMPPGLLGRKGSMN